MTHAYPSRWGFHPCDYATFQLLKQLNKLCLRARRRFAEWQRWTRKQPQNRVVRRKVLDDHGRVIGTRVLGPRPEPRLCPVFCKEALAPYAGPEAPPRAGTCPGPLCFNDWGIPEVYRAARTPMPSPDRVSPLRLSRETIRTLLSEAEAFFAAEDRRGD